MESPIKLYPETNSDQTIPAYALINAAEALTKVKWVKSLIDWEGNKNALALSISDLIECELFTESHTPFEGNAWEQIISNVSNVGVTIVFTHRDTGGELFFEFNAKQFPEYFEGLGDSDYTVLGHYEETNQTFCQHVHATKPTDALTHVAQEFPDAVFTAVIKGHHTENHTLYFPGESLVDAETILEQPEVFGDPAHYQDEEFEISANENCPDSIGFLVHRQSGSCIGGFQRSEEGFNVCILTPYDERDGDSQNIDTVPTIEEAKRVLWDNRQTAFMPIKQ
ncbi:hypothetical protein [Vibrio mediterranei]|uniref:hypothetical protein n=1 Tax=Vibrio mediterranei TaxID=689 RepID=UPI0040690C05